VTANACVGVLKCPLSCARAGILRKFSVDFPEMSVDHNSLDGFIAIRLIKTNGYLGFRLGR